MRLRLLAAAPLVLAAILVGLILGLSPSGELDLLFRAEGVLVKAVAAAGCAAAALSFAPRSRLRVAWSLMAGCYLVLAVKTTPVLGDDLVVVRVGTLLANVLAPLGSLLMVQAWYGSGLAPAIPSVRRRVLPLLTFVGALFVAGPGLISRVEAVGQDPLAILLVFSALGDIGSMTLLAPLLLIALAMRGGRLAWPWALLAAGELSWLLYDVVSSLEPDVFSSPALVHGLPEMLRASGCLFYAAAGFAQRFALQAAPRYEEAGTA